MGKWQERRDERRERRERSRSPRLYPHGDNEDDWPVLRMYPPTPASLAALHTFHLVFHRWSVEAAIDTVLPHEFADKLRFHVLEREPVISEPAAVMFSRASESRFPIMRRLFGSLSR